MVEQTESGSEGGNVIDSKVIVLGIFHWRMTEVARARQSMLHCLTSTIACNRSARGGGG
ncbi:hypothetical protein SCLCIDRAFT_751511 [Scleroderma citrinum Foug A]|uniref:Uncharacterized protein n=1 Tax=Scleroderma citrinum Foug A TaxID=1036808 RepID=A0A0C2YM57_9AGAM|nr:hypothetical protein SCLCIDRAFT_751511 [Scleroderma citrinum Foug A]